jgi:hypothetical protein
MGENQGVQKTTRKPGKNEVNSTRLQSDVSESLILGILEKINEYQRKW